MTEPVLATAEEVRPLYALMEKLKALEPWTWMYEDQIFGVQDPSTGEVGFVSVMGNLGEHLAISVYRGPRGLEGFRALHQRGVALSPELLLQTPQLQASFEDREMIESEERAIIKALGLKFRGRQAWPQFRNYGDGLAPYFLSSEEARFLTVMLEQVIAFTPRLRTSKRLVGPLKGNTVLVRKATRAGDTLTWSEAKEHIPPPPPRTISMSAPPPLMQAIYALPRRRMILEADVFMIMSMIKEKGARPYFPYMMMLVESSGGMVVGMELLQPLPTLEAMWSKLPEVFFTQIKKLGFIPTEIHLRQPLLIAILETLEKDLGFKLKVTPILPYLDQARGALYDFTHM